MRYQITDSLKLSKFLISWIRYLQNEERWGWLDIVSHSQTAFHPNIKEKTVWLHETRLGSYPYEV